MVQVARSRVAPPLEARSIRLRSGELTYQLRRSPRSRGLRMTIDPQHGLVVSAPPPGRRGWSEAATRERIEAFLRSREAWIVRHLRSLEAERAAHRERGGPRDGGVVRYLGLPHRIRVVAAPATGRRARVERSGAEDGDELLVVLPPRDRRPVAVILEAWFRERARHAIDLAVRRHADALRVRPRVVDLRDPRTRWGSASKDGRVMLSWRLVLAPPESLETVVVHELAHLRVFGHGPGFWSLVASRRPDHLADRAWLRRHARELHSALEPMVPDAEAAGETARETAAVEKAGETAAVEEA